MPKVFGREFPPIVIAGMGLLAIALAYTALVPPEEPATKSGIKSAKRKATTTKGSIFTEQDYSIRFASSKEPIKNSFRPLVVRVDRKAALSGALPEMFSGGGNWVYTGMAQVNGVSQGLLEDRKSGDAEFVRKGQTWKNSTITDFDEDSLTLLGPGGALYTMIVGSDTELQTGAGVNSPVGVGPVTVPGNMVGEIGVQPMQGSNGERPRRRSRWNRDNAEGNLEE